MYNATNLPTYHDQWQTYEMNFSPNRQQYWADTSTKNKTQYVRNYSTYWESNNNFKFPEEEGNVQEPFSYLFLHKRCIIWADGSKNTLHFTPKWTWSKSYTQKGSKLVKNKTENQKEKHNGEI